MPNLDPSKVNCNCSKPSKQGQSGVSLSTEGTFGIENLSPTTTLLMNLMSRTRMMRSMIYQPVFQLERKS